MKKATLFLGLVLVVTTALPTLAQDMVTICHAAGQEGTTQFITLTIPWEAAFGEAGHFFEDGTPRAGHEDDYLGPCEESDTTTTTTVEETTTTTEAPTTTTTTPQATSTVTTLLTTEWTADSTCNTISVDFNPEEIIRVQVREDFTGDLLLPVEDIEAPGDYDATVGSTTQFILVPVTREGFVANPEEFILLVDSCPVATTTTTSASPTTDPTDPDDTLPFTGFDPLPLGMVGLAAAAIGTLLAVATRKGENDGS